MGRTLAELGETMSAEEYALHLADDAMSPWGPERMADLPAAMVATVIANANRDPKQKPDPYRIADFLFFDREPDTDVEATDETLRAFVQFVNQD